MESETTLGTAAPVVEKSGVKEKSSQKSPTLLLLRVHALQSWRRLSAIREQSKLLSGAIMGFMACYLIFSYWLFERGLGFIEKFPGLGPLLTERLMFLLFAFLFALLLLSNLVIHYTNLFRNRETQFLVTMPVANNSIFRWKFIESTTLASWAFLFLIAPLLAAYGVKSNADWSFYPFVIVLIALFIALPAALGAFCAINLARFMDRRAFQLIAVGLAAAALLSAFFWLRPEAVTEDSLETRVLAVLDRLLSKTKFSLFPFLPSYWLASGAQLWIEGAFASAAFFLMTLLSYSLFFGAIAFTKLGDYFYEAFSATMSRESVFGQWSWFRHWKERERAKKFVYRPSWVERLARLVPGLRSDTRAVVLKDMLMFWRDTAQWGQTLMLFGLLGVYIINLRHFSRQLSNPFWVHLVSYLNLLACSLNLATLTTRFVYPQFSLEGKRIWMVGMAPMGIVNVAKVKYWLACSVSLVVTIGLTALSCYMLQLPWQRTLFFISAITVMTFSLNGLAVGLGLLYPNFKEENPSKIVSGFGGTFCLIMSFLYIVGSVACLAFGAPRSGSVTVGESIMRGMLSWGSFAVMSFLIGYLPIRLGFRKLPSMEI